MKGPGLCAGHGGVNIIETVHVSSCVLNENLVKTKRSARNVKTFIDRFIGGIVVVILKH